MTITQEKLNATDKYIADSAAYVVAMLGDDIDAEIDDELTKAREALAEAQTALDNGELELAAEKVAEAVRHIENAIRLLRQRIGG